MKILATGDWHIGAAPDFGPPGQRLNDHAEMAARIAAECADVDLVLFSGDAFHRRRPTPAEYMVWRGFLDAVPCPVLSLAGNHDVTTLDAPDALQPLVRAAHHHYRRPGVERYDECDVALLPWAHPGRAVADFAEGYDAAVGAVADRLVEIAAGLRAECSDPAILMLHWSVTGAWTPTGTSTTLFHEPLIPLQDLAGQDWSAVVCGHVHKPQGLAGGDHHPVFYTGSPWAVDWAEVGMFHGYATFQVEPGVDGVRDFAWTPVEDRPFVALNDGDIQWKGESPVFPDVRNAVVRARVVIPDGGPHPFDVLGPNLFRGALYEAGAAHVYQVQVEDERRRQERRRVPGLDENAEPLAALESWLVTQKIPKDVAVRMMTKAADLVEQVAA